MFVYINLMVSRHCVYADIMKWAFGVAEIFKGVIATGNGVVIGLGDGIQRSLIYTETPDEVRDVSHVFLVRLRCENRFGKPRPGTFANPRI
jgi:hypothetical protein